MASASTIGPGTFIRGSVRGEGDLDIHGRIEGSVAVSGELLIAETALIRSDVSAKRVVVRGAVLGNISADDAIVLEQGARVVGDLEAPQVGIRPGGLLRGNVSTEGPMSSGAITVEPATVARARTSPKAASVVMAPIGRGTPAARAPAAGAPRPAPHAASAAPLPPVRPPPRPAAAAAPPTRAGATLAAAGRPPSPPSPARAPEPPAGATPSTATHNETVLSAPAQPPAKHEHEHEEEGSTSLSEPDGPGGPPPPVVPALRKGAKASLRRKGAR